MSDKLKQFLSQAGGTKKNPSVSTQNASAGFSISDFVQGGKGTEEKWNQLKSSADICESFVMPMPKKIDLQKAQTEKLSTSSERSSSLPPIFRKSSATEPIISADGLYLFTPFTCNCIFNVIYATFLMALSNSFLEIYTNFDHEKFNLICFS